MSAKGPLRVVWSEGLLMAPQHLQQLDYYHERLLGQRLAALEAHPWGVCALELDAAALSAGQLKLNRFQGVLPDGAPLDLEPGDPELPPSRPIGELFPHTSRALEVFLALPREREGLDNYSEQAGRGARYRLDTRRVRDVTAAQQVIEVAFGQRNLCLLLGGEPAQDHVAIKIAEIVRDSAGQLIEADSYVPPCMRVGASPFLIDGLRRLLQRMAARQVSLSAALRQSTPSAIAFSATDITRYLLLAAVNGFLPPLQHLADSGDVTPRAAYLLLSQFAGQLCTFAVDGDPTRLPGFDYQDLRATFEGLFARITALLLATVGDHFLSIKLTADADGLFKARLEDERLAACAQFVLAVRSERPETQVASDLPQLAKLASWNDIKAIVNSATMGAQLEVTHRPPPEIPLKPGMVYFRIDAASSHWRTVLSERKLALHLPAPFAARNTSVELMAIPRRAGAGTESERVSR